MTLVSSGLISISTDGTRVEYGAVDGNEIWWKVE